MASGGAARRRPQRALRIRPGAPRRRRIRVTAGLDIRLAPHRQHLAAAAADLSSPADPRAAVGVDDAAAGLRATGGRPDQRALPSEPPGPDPGGPCGAGRAELPAQLHPSRRPKLLLRRGLRALVATRGPPPDSRPASRAGGACRPGAFAGGSSGGGQGAERLPRRRRRDVAAPAVAADLPASRRTRRGRLDAARPAPRRLAGRTGRTRDGRGRAGTLGLRPQPLAAVGQPHARGRAGLCGAPAEAANHCPLRKPAREHDRDAAGADRLAGGLACRRGARSGRRSPRLRVLSGRGEGTDQGAQGGIPRPVAREHERGRAAGDERNHGGDARAAPGPRLGYEI